MLKASEAYAARHRRRAARARRLPRRVAALGGKGASLGETSVERAEIDRGAGWEAAVGPRPGRRRRALPRRGAGAVPRPGPARRRRARAPGTTRSPPRTTRSPTCVMSDELRAGLYSFDLVQRRAKRPAGAPDRGLARPVTKVGIVGAGLMASQLALLFVQRLQVPVVLTDLDQERVEKGVGYVHARGRHAARQGPARPRQGQPAQGARHRLGQQGGLRRRRRGDRGGVRGPEGQGSRCSPRSRPSSAPSASC